MLVLDQTDRSLVIKLAGAVTTNQLDFTAHYADTTTTTFTPGCNIDDTNDTTEVTLVAAPAASTQRQVKCIIVHNMDTVSATVIIEYADDAVRRRICRETLAANATLRLEGAWLSTALQGVTNGDAHDHSGGDGATIPITGGGTGAVTAAAARAALGLTGFGGKNGIINGDFPVAQRGTTFNSGTTPANSDDTYLLDRWVLLSDGNDIVDVSQEATVVPTGMRNSVKFDVETANKKFGFIQIIEAKNSKRFLGGVASLQFRIRTSDYAKLDSVKAAILTWSSTADAVTSDVVSAWGNEGDEPTWAANWTREGSVVTQALTANDTWYTVTLENVAIDTASGANVAVVVWSDVTDNTVGDFLYLSGIQLEPGTVATEFEARDIGAEVRLCKRYYQKSYRLTTDPYTNTFEGMWYSNSTTDDSKNMWFTIMFDGEMRAAPTITFIKYDGSSANWYFKDVGGSGNTAMTAYSAGLGTRSFMAYTGVLSNAWAGAFAHGHWTAEIEL
jgi:hypothetical protein